MNISANEIVMSLAYLNKKINIDTASFEARINELINDEYEAITKYDIENKQIMIYLIDENNNVKYINIFKQNNDILYSTTLADDKYEIIPKIRNIMIECFEYLEKIYIMSKDIEINFGCIKAVNANYYIRFNNKNIALIDYTNKEVKEINDINLSQFPITNNIMFKLDNLPISLQLNYELYKASNSKNNWIKKLNISK